MERPEFVSENDIIYQRLFIRHEFFQKGRGFERAICFSQVDYRVSYRKSWNQNYKLKHQRKLDSKKQQQQYTIEQARSAIAPHHDTNDTWRLFDRVNAVILRNAM